MTSVCVHTISNQLTDFLRNSERRYASVRQSKDVSSNSLQSVITAWRERESVRRGQHWRQFYLRDQRTVRDLREIRTFYYDTVCVQCKITTQAFKHKISYPRLCTTNLLVLRM